MHNLSTVIRFEITRTLKKKSFWVIALLIPSMIAGIFAVVYFSNKATNEAMENVEKQKFSIAIYDPAQHIRPEIAQAVGARTVQSAEEGLALVKDQKIDAFYNYPSSLSRPVEVAGKDVGLFDNGRYEGVAKLLMTQSATQQVTKDVASILQGRVTTSQTIYRDGQPYDGFKQMIAPGIFLVLFYVLITMFGNQMLNSTIEEKENRVIEMILTTIQARTLIIGKIISLNILSLIQIVVILVPVLTMYLLLHDKLALPTLDLSSIPLDAGRIFCGLLIFITSYMLFTGVLVTIGAAMPTAKEAGSFFGVVMMLIFGPLYAASLFVSAPSSPIVTFLSFFPLTAPIPLLLRNAVGNLSYTHAAIAIVILAISAFIITSIGVRVFRYGALEYSRKLSLREILGR